MQTWPLVLIGGGIGLVGVILYAAVRLYLETAKKVTWTDVIVVVIIGAIGLLLAGMGDWLLKPVSVPTWLRWTVIGVAGGTSLTFAMMLRRARSDGVLITFYVVAMFFGFLAMRLFVMEIAGK